MAHAIRSATMLLCALLVAACGGSDGRTAQEPVTPVVATSAASAPTRTCPNDYGGDCLGALSAGTYTTTSFQPTLTYTVPDYWSNYEDLPGNFLLVPDGGDLDGVDAGTSDYIGIYTSVRAVDGCGAGLVPGVGTSPDDIAKALRRTPGLVVTEPAPAVVGGLEGLVLDLTMEPGWTQGCEDVGSSPVVPLYKGTSPSDFEHAMIEGLTMRLFLLARGAETVAIEINDVHGGGRLPAYTDVASKVVFAAG